MAYYVCGCKHSSLQAVTDLAPFVQAQVALTILNCQQMLNFVHSICVPVNLVHFLRPNLLLQL